MGFIPFPLNVRTLLKRCFLFTDSSSKQDCWRISANRSIELHWGYSHSDSGMPRKICQKTTAWPASIFDTTFNNNCQLFSLFSYLDNSLGKCFPLHLIKMLRKLRKMLNATLCFCFSPEMIFAISWVYSASCQVSEISYKYKYKFCFY